MGCAKYRRPDPSATDFLIAASQDKDTGRFFVK